MSTAKLMKVTTALSDLSSEPGASASQKLGNLKAVQRHIDGLIRKIEGEDPKRNHSPVSQVEGS